MLELDQFLIKSKVDLEILESEIRDEANILLPKRDVFADLSQRIHDYFNHRTNIRVIGLSGLRGVGKTTLMWQLAKEIFDHYSQDIYFFDTKELTQYEIKLVELFSKFETTILKKSFRKLDKPLILLFDEVHDAENWSKSLKILYGKNKRIFIICTGSSALLLDTNPDLATLWDLIHIYPFSFSEFIHFKSWEGIIEWQKFINTINKDFLEGKKFYTYKNKIKIEFIDNNSNPLEFIENEIDYLKNAKPIRPQHLANDLRTTIFFSENIDVLQERIKAMEPDINSYMKQINESFDTEQIKEYIFYYNIPRFFAAANKEKILKQTEEMFQKILWEDVLKWLQKNNTGDVLTSKMEDIPKITRVLYQLSASGEVNIEKLPSATHCSKKEVELFIDALIKAEILNPFSPYGGINTKINKNKKLFFMSPTLRLSLHGVLYGYDINADLQAILYEEIVAMYLKRLLPGIPLSYVSHKELGKKSADFLIETGDIPVMIEVKTRREEISQIAKSSINIRYGILIVAEAKNYSINNNTLIIPLNWFLLL